MPTSSFSMACWVSDGISLVWERRACTMSSPIRIMINPPAMRNAGSVIPNILKISVPAMAKPAKTTKQVQAARFAM